MNNKLRYLLIYTTKCILHLYVTRKGLLPTRRNIKHTRTLHRIHFR